MIASAAPLTGATSTGEAVQFWVLAVLAVGGALGMLLCRKAVHSALCLAATMLALALCYFAQGAAFLGAVQIVVYTGAIMMLFLFVVMLVGVSSADSVKEVLKGQRWAAVLCGIGFGVLLMAGIANARLRTFTGLAAANGNGGNVRGLARLIFTQYVWAFEVTGALLITAAVGAMVLTHREATTVRRSQRELAEQRVRLGQQITPLPAPGVYARHNAVDVPGLLPDGTPSELSVNQTLRARGQVREVGRELQAKIVELEAGTSRYLGRRTPKQRRNGDVVPQQPKQVTGTENSGSPATAGAEGEEES
ncbi:NADH-quinone oxidoreductase subunit J [Phaeacidiphilus oryzae]|uniref:NADH-quinone oxidoreductase subunit J n=1 Tax=Phaeacidiphilus oryzae TaxID=348818 RepID=UPI000A0727D0|nr:NADH-quinone oxidoreductase subunit J [Phaeacidiphilus oryzae]